MTWYMNVLYSKLIPDFLIRLVVRFLAFRKIYQLEKMDFSDQEEQRRKLIKKFSGSPIAIQPDLPNLQHYEVPPEFFQLVLGKRLKYSCCLWPEADMTLEEAEEAMLDLTCQRARLQDGMTVLDLGCGWGSLSLWIAEHYPACRVLSVSNSRDQIDFIRQRAQERGFQHIDGMVMDVNHLEIDRPFDRVISIEMFEHMKNYPALMQKISRLLNPGGMLFVHHFSHRLFAYEFQVEDQENWMAQTFFSGGTMPSDDLLLHFQNDLRLIDHWRVSGRHYARTLRAWLRRMDNRQSGVEKVLADAYGADHIRRWWINWRLFFIACEETWAFRQGKQYLVSHYLFDKRE